MAGIIEQAKGAPPQEEAKSAITPAAVRSQMTIPPDKAGAYERIVAAGKKILYSEQMQPQIDELIKAPGDMGQKIGQGVVGLIALLLDQSNGTLPPQLIIPAATELVAEVGDFLKQSGMKVSDADISEGMASMVELLMEKAGVSPEQLPELLKQQGGAQPPAAPAAPAAEPPAPMPAEA